MKFNLTKTAAARRSAFSLAEWVVGMALLGIVVLSLYSGMTFGMYRTKSTQEELRATQILLEKVEQLRLYTWDKINYVIDLDEPEDEADPFDPEDPHVTEDEPEAYAMPVGFTVPFKPGSTASNEVIYTGTLKVEQAPVSEVYSNRLLLVTVGLNWTIGGRTRTREVQTLFAKYGMQNNVPK